MQAKEVKNNDHRGCCYDVSRVGRYTRLVRVLFLQDFFGII